MAIFHCSIKIISRGKGKSAVAAAAYRSGEAITNAYDGITHDYTRKGGIVHTEIFLPTHAPREYYNRSVLWNAVEQTEKNKNAQLSREIELALPVELKHEQNIKLVREYCQKNFITAGMCADICIHDKKDVNPHAHVMLTMRPLQPDGSWGDKQKKEYTLDKNGEKIYDKIKRQYKCKTVQTNDWNEQSKAEEWRAGWAEIVNRFLADVNVTERVDHRSNERRGIEQLPTVHMGVAASRMEQRGITTEHGNRNREIYSVNQELRQLKARIDKLKNWLKDEAEFTVPNLQKVITEILNRNKDGTRWQRTVDLKTSAKIFASLQTNNITDLPQLNTKVTEMRGRFDDVSSKLKANERRQKVLAEHLRQADNYRLNKEIYKQYECMNPKKREAFYEGNRAAIVLYETAKKYLDVHLNGHAIPTKAWKSEAIKLTAEKDRLYLDYYRLKDEVRDAEIIKRAVEKMLKVNDSGKITYRIYQTAR